MKLQSDQADVIAFLASPATHAGAAVVRIDTHASIVFLAGDRAWKLKRAVRYDYLDFSTVERRRLMCEAELRINRRAAPALYRRVVAVTREADGSLALGGAGLPVDWLVEMVRFDQDRLFDRLAQSGALDIALMRPLASAIARFHAEAEHRADHGGRAGMRWVIDGNALGLTEQGAGMRWVIDGNALGLTEQGAGVLDPAAGATLADAARRALDRNAALLEARRAGGSVRQCHGDLHLRNIVLLDGAPTLFDAIEFNDEIACVDVWYDVAFVLMDLWRRRLFSHANAVWNGYLFDSRDYGGIPLLPLFLSCRAAVRAKTSVTAAHLQHDAQRRGELQRTAAEYLRMAIDLLRPPAAVVVAVGGFSGSGKSTVARAIAPQLGAAPGAVVIRSDEVRKQLCGVDPRRRLDASAYAEDVTARVYATIIDRAMTVGRAGHAAVVDAVFARPADRVAIEQAAAAAAIPFAGIWLDAPEALIVERLSQRRADVSDADAAVVRRQIAAGAGNPNWRRIDAGRGYADVVEQASAIIDEARCAGRAQ